jgi:hypothetical protein
VTLSQEETMRSALKWAGRGVFALAIAAVIMAGGPRYATAIDCPDPKPDPYLCPPLTEEDCYDACDALGYYAGHCFGSGCCTCAY